MPGSSVPAKRIDTLPLSFYERDTVVVARNLLGKVLRVKDGNVWRSGIIVEDEAYLKDDPACHAYHGPNQRNQSMFKGPGTVYVYRIHQVFCVNAVTNAGEAALIRAVEPLENVLGSTKGPGRLCRGLGITGRHNGTMLTGSTIQIVDYDFGSFETGVSARTGISKAMDLPLRFFVKGNRFVSRGQSSEN